MRKDIKARGVAVSDIYGPGLHGEGPLAGRPSIFVRCDGAQPDDMTPDEIFDRVLDLSAGFPMLVTLCGSSAAAQPFGKLLELGRDQAYSFALESGGTMAQDWFCRLDHLILSPKGPSSRDAGFPPDFGQRLRRCLEAAKSEDIRLRPAIKIAIFGEADYQFARDVADAFPELEFFLQPGVPALSANAYGDESSRLIGLRSDILRRTAWLVERVSDDHWSDVIIMPQLHQLIWGDKRGV